MTHGSFAWYDLAAPDPEGAERFYTAVMGWTAEPAEMAGLRFTLFRADGVPVAGMRPLSDLPEGTQSGWTGYVEVDDVEAVARQVTEGGGVLQTGTEGVGGRKFARARDPHGARFAFMEPGGEASPKPCLGEAGHVGWHELLADDGEAGFAFYSGLFGWTRGEAIDMGAMGTYQLFDVDGRSVGGMMTKVPQMPAAAWTFYVGTEAIDAATERVTAAGGKIMFGPQEVPGGGWIINVMDPQGVMIALVAPRR